MKKIYTQRQATLEALRRKGRKGMTSREARDVLHIMDFPKVISELRKSGNNITKETVRVETVYGGANIKVYRLVENV